MKYGYQQISLDDFKDNLEYYLTQSTLEDTKIILIKERYGEFVCMPRKKFNDNLFTALMCGLDETIQNKGLRKIIKMDEKVE